MISPQTNIECLGRLGMLRHFPIKDAVVAEIGKLLNELCQNDQEARRLVELLSQDFSEWPGPSAIRRVYAERIRSRQPEDRPEGCELCDGTGFRPAFNVIETLPSRDKRLHVIYCAQWRDQPEETKKLDRQFKGSATHKLYTACRACRCSLGQQHRAAFDAALRTNVSYQGGKRYYETVDEFLESYPSGV